MEKITGQNVWNYILSSTNDLDNLYDYLEIDFNSTIDGIFKALYKLLLRNYSQNKSRCDYLIEILDSIVNEFDVKKLNYLNRTIENFNRNIISNLNKKQRILVNESINKINDIHNKACNKLISDTRSKKIRILQYMIFHEKNISFIEQTINDKDNVLAYKNSDGDNIFAIIIKRYIYLNDQNEEEIDYLYNIILLFIESRVGQDILNNKVRYQRIIKQSKLGYKEHIIKLLELFDPKFTITLDELEQRYNKRFDFPKIVYNELNTFIMDNDGRRNFTNQECITIDGENALCLDDALYIEKNLDGTHTLYIHIADVPSFVPYNSSVDEEARKRVESLYLRDTIIHLYPDLICNRMCSLLPNNNRNVITYIYKLDSKCRLIDEYPNVVKGKIRVRYKLSYEEVDRRIRHFANSELDRMLIRLFLFSINQKELNPDKELYRKLENFLEFEKHHESLKSDYSAAANIVHESMILANHGISNLFRDLDLPYMYRELYIPTDDFINEQMQKIQSLDEKFDPNNQNFRNNLRDSYQKARYTDRPTYHKGLNLSSSSHSTSPLRRYPDAHCQYLIYEFLFNKRLDDLTIQRWAYRTEELVEYANNQKQYNDNFSKHYNYLSYKKLIKRK